MRIILSFLILSVILVLQTSSSRSEDLRTQTLCVKDEQVFFSCSLVNSKTVSLCGSQNLTRTAGYLQYRYGKKGNLELEFPREKNSSSTDKFVYDHYFRAQFDRTEISFENAGASYTLYDYYDGEEKPTRMERGIIVKSGSSAKEINLRCRNRMIGHYEKLSELLTQP